MTAGSKRIGGDTRQHLAGDGASRLPGHDPDLPRPTPPEVSRAPVRLTRREREVLALIARGQSGKEIALALGIAPKTVEHYREKVKMKVGVTRTACLILYAVRVGLVAP